MAQQASDPAQAASTVVLPMALQALVVSEDILRTPAQFAPLIEPNYATLLQTDEAGSPKHDLMDDIDVSYWRTQARFNPRFVDLGTGKLKPDRTGIYLSWCLPKIYRAAIAPASSATQNQAEWNSRKLREGFRLSEADKKDSKDGQLKRDPVQFRPVPDRWLIVRSVRNNPWYGKRFIVESNCIRRLDDPDIVGKTETQTCPAMDPTQPSQEQPMLRLGRALQLDASYPSSMDPVRRRYREPFCAAELGHEFFPDYAPHNMGTFSFFDDLKDVADADIYLDNRKLI